MTMGALCFMERSLAHWSPEKIEVRLSHTNKKYYSFLYQNSDIIHIITASATSAYIVKRRRLKGRGQFRLGLGLVVVTDRTECTKLCRFFVAEWQSHSIWYFTKTTFMMIYQHSINKMNCCRYKKGEKPSQAQHLALAMWSSVISFCYEIADLRFKRSWRGWYSWFE